jgi:hypothetical protein
MEYNKLINKELTQLIIYVTIVEKENNSYPEWWRDWPDETQQPPF